MPNANLTYSLPFSSRAELHNSPALTAYLLSLISIKRSNLCVSADVHTTYELLSLAEEIGDQICVLKTHADIIDDFSRETIKALKKISARKHFLLFEDRKLGDIGNTVQSQYTRGPLAIATWAHITNAHLLPGPSIVSSLHSAADATLTSLNQSVATTISTGTPRRSLESAHDPTSFTSIHSTAFDSSAAADSAQSAFDIETSPSPPPQTILTHNRRYGQATATTTISQTFEPTFPRKPASLIHSLSIGESTGSADREMALQQLGPPPHARGLLLLAQMSSAGNLATKEYTKACVDAARADKEFVLGFVTQQSLNTDSDDAFLSFAPGVNLPPEDEDDDNVVRGDGKGQQYRLPDEVVGRDGIDIVIVGRGILKAADRAREAERYREASWRAYKARVGGR